MVGRIDMIVIRHSRLTKECLKDQLSLYQDEYVVFRSLLSVSFKFPRRFGCKLHLYAKLSGIFVVELWLEWSYTCILYLDGVVKNKFLFPAFWGSKDTLTKTPKLFAEAGVIVVISSVSRFSFHSGLKCGISIVVWYSDDWLLSEHFIISAIPGFNYGTVSRSFIRKGKKTLSLTEPAKFVSQSHQCIPPQKILSNRFLMRKPSCIPARYSMLRNGGLRFHSWDGPMPNNT